MTRDWDAATYDRVADPQTRWGSVVLDRLPLTGDERVLDAGCGSGRVTELLADAPAPRARRRARRFGGDDRGGPRAAGAVRRPDRVRRGRPRRVRCRSTGRSTRSCRPRPSTGSSTTTRCSRTWRRSCDRAAGSSPSAAGSATSPRSSGSSRRSATAGSARSTSRRRWRPSAGSMPRASSTSNAG